MSINHIFIFTDTPDQSTKELLQFGLIEGSNRIHKGQGTQNRKFYFQNFYLELLWVSNINEIKNEITAPSKLFERSKYKSNGNSPFGLCLNYDTKDNKLFENHFSYKPMYLPKEIKIEVLTNEKHPTLPWTFRWQADIPSSFENEPANKYQLTDTIFQIKDIKNKYIENISIHKNINFINSSDINLTLEFDNHKQNETKKFKTLPLIIKY